MSYKPKTVYTELAYKVVKATVKNQDISFLYEEEVPVELLVKQACFVTLHLTDGSLRGCIGTIEPYRENLHIEIIENAIAACTRDSRFSPVTEEELNDIEISVDVLSLPEEIEDISLLDPAKYGLIISDGSFRKAVLLPALPSVTSVDEQIKIVKQKAGISQDNLYGLKLYRFTATRYY